jgi:hypothetical protein
MHTYIHIQELKAVSRPSIIIRMAVNPNCLIVEGIIVLALCASVSLLARVLQSCTAESNLGDLAHAADRALHALYVCKYVYMYMYMYVDTSNLGDLHTLQTVPFMLCMCVCMYMYVCKHLFRRQCTPFNIHVCIYACIFAYIYIYIYIYTYTYIHTYVYIRHAIDNIMHSIHIRCLRYRKAPGRNHSEP